MAEKDRLIQQSNYLEFSLPWIGWATFGTRAAFCRRGNLSLPSSKMKLALCGVLFLCCVVLVAAVPSRREEELLSDIEDLVAGLKENLMEMELREMEAEENRDLQELEMERRQGLPPGMG
uniref:Uncharacterized protein n=1 Tax=Branchiostoma floridae TaxID=7739 RepID=C3YIX5_BRAFL|eukprot:XP_002603838.1 hypothetical protein BRAFLDRAFT_129669 [Branchiostoma floridae]